MKLKLVSKYCFIGIPFVLIGFILLFTKVPKWVGSALISSGVTIITLNLLGKLKK